jgi:hypothetical protein
MGTLRDQLGLQFEQSNAATRVGDRLTVECVRFSIFLPNSVRLDAAELQAAVRLTADL